MTKQEVEQIQKILKKLEEEENTVFSPDEYQKVLVILLQKQGLTLEDFNEANKEKKVPNVLIQREELTKEIEALLVPIQEAIQSLEAKRIAYQELLDLPHIPTSNEIQALIPPILTRDDVEQMIPEVKIPKQKELAETTKAINDINDKIVSVEKKVNKKEKKKTKKQVNELSGRIKEVENDWIEFQKMNTLRQTDESKRLRQNLKKLKVEAAAPALFRIDDLIGKLKATPTDLSSQCDSSTTVFDIGFSFIGVNWLSLNGTNLIEGKDFTQTSSTAITITTVTPDSGEELWISVIKA